MIRSFSRHLAFAFVLILGNCSVSSVLAAGVRLVVFEGFYRPT
jgi:hypothetical protein